MSMTFAGQILRGKTLSRALFNNRVAQYAKGLSGRVLDLAGGGSYESLLPKSIALTCTNIDPARGAVVDFNKPLPYADQSFDHAFLFQALYIADEPLALMAEMRRVVRSGGTILIASPFLQNEMREPHDYMRLTSEGLARLFVQAGIPRFSIEPYGERFSVAANLLHPFLLFSIVRLPVYALARLLDGAVPYSLRSRHPAPLGYMCQLYL